MNFNIKYDGFKAIFETELEKHLKSYENTSPKEIFDAVKYAISNGGKRIRPVLCLASAEMLNVDLQSVLPFAVSVEMIHSYSLVHDDLPAMDNDDFRRGKLSTHKAFGEAVGILAGDGLLNMAFNTAILGVKNENGLDALNILFDYSGINGMIAGQVLDLKSEKTDGDENLLLNIFVNKTSKLLTAPILVPSTLANKVYFDELKDFGTYLGILFQITDDVLDVTATREELGKTPNKDKDEDKLTAIKVYGLEGAKLEASKYYEKCKKILKNIPNSQFMLELLDSIYLRKK